MRPDRLVGIAVLVVALGPARGSAMAGDSIPEAKLKVKGLTREGRVFVHAEAEKPVVARMREVRGTTFAAFAKAAEKQAAAETVQMQAMQLDQQRLELQANLNLLNQQINAQNSSMGGGRYARAARSMPNPLKAEQQQMTAALNQTTAMQRSVKSQIPSAKDKGIIDDEVKKKAEAFKVDLTELRKMVDEVTKKYADLAADESVKKWIDELQKAGHATMKLGPSEAFARDMKELDQAERQFLGKRTVAHPKKKAVAKTKK